MALRVPGSAQDAMGGTLGDGRSTGVDGQQVMTKPPNASGHIWLCVDLLASRNEDRPGFPAFRLRFR